MNVTADPYLAPRRCLREPIADIFSAAESLRQAVEAHVSGDRARAGQLIVDADRSSIREWVSPLLGSAAAYSDRQQHVRYRKLDDAPPLLPKSKRVPVRMPNATQRAELIAIQGRNCAFCRIPLVSAEVRKALVLAYPSQARWGPTFDDCHAALLAMWLQFDHVVPHSRGGTNELTNILLTCSGCNYGRMSHTLEEVGVEDPRLRPIERTDWDGLEAVLQ